MAIINPYHNIRQYIRTVWRFYADGFRGMTIGRTLWTIILIKLVVIFVVLKLLFFPDVVKRESRGGDRAGYVAGQLLGR